MNAAALAYEANLQQQIETLLEENLRLKLQRIELQIEIKRYRDQTGLPADAV